MASTKKIVLCQRKDDGQLRLFKPDHAKMNAAYWKQQNDKWNYFDVSLPTKIFKMLPTIADLKVVEKG